MLDRALAQQSFAVDAFAPLGKCDLVQVSQRLDVNLRILACEADLPWSAASNALSPLRRPDRFQSGPKTGGQCSHCDERFSLPPHGVYSTPLWT